MNDPNTSKRAWCSCDQAVTGSQIYYEEVCALIESTDHFILMY